MSNERLFLIDSFSFIFRAYYGALRLKNGAAYAFVQMVMNLLETHRPSHAACVFDRPEPTFRHELYPEYKANRAEMPEDLRPQIPLIRKLIAALDLPIVELPGYEADDVMGTLARRAADQGLEAVIVSPDKDLLQLVDDTKGIRVLNLKDGEVWIDRAGVKERFGVWPEQVVDVLSLMGDASDNVKGVDGIGEKGARELIETYGNMEGLLAHRTELKRKAHREGLEAAMERLPLVRRLVTVVTDLELALAPDQLRWKGFDPAKMRESFKSMGFERLVKTLTPTGEAAEGVQRQYRRVHSREELEAVARDIRTQGRVSVDTETTSLDPNRGHLAGISLAWESNQGIYIPLGHLQVRDGAVEGALPGLLEGSGLPESMLDLVGHPQAYFESLSPYLVPDNAIFSDVKEILGPVFEDPAILKLGQNLKYDLQVLGRHGLQVQGLGHDSMLLSFLLESGLRHNLDDLSVRHLGIKPVAYAEVTGKGKGQKRFDEVDIDTAARYSGEDADLALQLCEKLDAQLQDPQLRRLYEEVDLPLVEVLADLESTGLCLDTKLLSQLASEMGRQRDEVAAQIQFLAGEAFNLNSPSQLGKILYEKLQLPVLKRTDKTKAPSTDEDVLQTLADKHGAEIARHLLVHRQLQKLLGTYVEALPKLVNPLTGRLHTSLHQAAVATGRLASSEPNLQNIPIRTPEGRAIRGAFVPRPGWILLDADYSQIELRVAASLAQDPVLMEAFEKGEDIHRRTAAEVFGLSLEQVGSKERSAAKAVNFGLLYGQGPWALSEAIGVSVSEAKAFIERYFQRMPKVHDWIEGVKQRAVAEGQVRTAWGRIREIPELSSKNQNLLAQGLREAVNTVVQGTAADLMRRAMVRLHRALKAEGLQTKLLLQVHDELLLEAPPEEEGRASQILKEAMEGADDLGPLSVKLAVEVHSGPSWLACKD